MGYFCSFTSGSKGNCALCVIDGARILIDAGTNTKYINSCLRELGLGPGDLNYIVITHAHSDHVSALPVLLKHTQAKLVCSYDTFDIIQTGGYVPTLFEPGETLDLGGVKVETAATPHDCLGSCCYSFGEGEHGLAYCTDMGVVTPEIFELMRRQKNIFIESNHDIEMLKTGPYPYYLKQRILSPRGHLSNADCAVVAARLALEGAGKIMLGHLSETNNRPDIAVSESLAALDKMGADRGVLLGAATARKMSPPVEI